MNEVWHDSRRTLRWAIASLILSSVVVILITAFSRVSFSDLSTIGLLPFALASAASLARLFVQALRFREISAALAGTGSTPFAEVASTRIGSEFVALTTPALVGGEFVRAAWLSSKGIAAGRALWIGYFEVMIDVYVGSAVSLLAAAYAFIKGVSIVGTVVVAVIVPLLAGYTAVFLIPALRGVKVPDSVFTLAGYFVGKARAEAFKVSTEAAATAFSQAAREVLSKKASPLLARVVILTCIQAVLSGISLWAIFGVVTNRVNIFSSILVAYAAQAIAAIPVSLGGSGLTELAVQLYTSSVLGFSSWGAVILWRIASYHFVLAASGIFFLRLIRRLMVSQSTRTVTMKTSDTK